jgi:hypothetical protein
MRFSCLLLNYSSIPCATPLSSSRLRNKAGDKFANCSSNATASQTSFRTATGRWPPPLYLGFDY